MIKQELRNFTDKVSSDITKVTKAYMLTALNTKEAHSKQSKENMMTYHSTKLEIYS